jgi:hypothetical protein
MATKIATATYLPQWPIHLNLRLLRASAFVETRSMKRYPFLGTLHHIDSDCMHTIDLLRGKLRTCELNARVPDDAMTIKLSRTTIWTVVILLATVFVLVGFSKLVGPSALRWGERLSRWGYPSGSQYMSGIVDYKAATKRCRDVGCYYDWCGVYAPPQRRIPAPHTAACPCGIRSCPVFDRPKTKSQALCLGNMPASPEHHRTRSQ